MIAATIDRVHAVGTPSDPVVVTNAEQAIAVHRALNESGYPDATILLEPAGRNTAPAVAVAAHHLLAEGSDPLMLVLPADHVITDEAAFAGAVDAGTEVAERGALVTFGMTPTSAETGYGYIRSGDRISDRAFAIAEFKEKPDAETAADYVASGDYWWNSGMFLFRASRYLEELARARPDIAQASGDAFAQATAGRFGIHLGSEAFGLCPSESIDYAVMEGTTSGAVVPADIGWSDVGSWSAIWEILPKDDAGNVLVGDVAAVGATGSYVRADGRLIALVGVDDLVVVDTPDSILVASRPAAQDVKSVVEILVGAGRREAFENDTEFATWGTAQTLSDIPGHLARLVRIDPGADMPEHTRRNRVVHLQIVEGSAEVGTDGGTVILEAGETFQVAEGSTASVRNPTETILMLVEISVDTVLESGTRHSLMRKRGDSA